MCVNVSPVPEWHRVATLGTVDVLFKGVRKRSLGLTAATDMTFWGSYAVIHSAESAFIAVRCNQSGLTSEPFSMQMRNIPSVIKNKH
jgi:hypothetical protein